MGMVGGLVGVVAGLLLTLFPHLGSWAVAADDGTARTIGLSMAVLGAIALVVALAADSHPQLARFTYLLTGLVGLAVASILWVPAAFFLLVGSFTRGYG
jgi:hypothetical protein